MSPDELDETERAELERLRQQLANLKTGEQEPRPPDERSGTGRRKVRWVVASVLIILATLLAPVALVARYARAEVLDTDRYVATVAPLAENPHVQAVIVDQLTEQIFVRLDVEGTLRDGLERVVELGGPEVLPGLATPVAGQVESFVHDQVARLVATDEFADLWAQAHRAAHDRLKAVLTGVDGERVQIDDGRVTVDLGAVVERVKQRMIDRGFGLAERIPEVDYEITVLESSSLASAQEGVRWLDRSATVLPLVCLGLIVAAVFVAPGRRRALLAAAVGVTGAMLLVAVTLAVMRAWYESHGRSEVMTPEAATSVARTVLVPLRTSMRAVFAVGVITILAILVTGPSATAQRFREAVTGAFDAIRRRTQGGREVTPVEAWVGAHKTYLRLGLVAAGALALVLWDYPSAGVVLTIALLVMVGMAAVELLGHQPGWATEGSDGELD